MVLLLLECGPSSDRTQECLIEQRRRMFAAAPHPMWMIGLKAGLARRLIPIISRRLDRLSESSDQHDERPRGSGLAWRKRFRSGLKEVSRCLMGEADVVFVMPEVGSPQHRSWR
jgi:hypothetical protein